MQEYTSFNKTIMFTPKNKTKFEKFYDKITYLKKILNPQPNKLPIDLKYFPLEKTHFKVKNYNKIKNKLLKNRKINGIYNFNKLKYKLYGKIVYNQGKDEIIFRVNFYKIGLEQYIVEFQRRDGCALTWYKHYQKMKKEIEHLLN